MDFKKILAGMSALAIASTVAVAAFAETSDVTTDNGSSNSTVDNNVDSSSTTANESSSTTETPADSSEAEKVEPIVVDTKDAIAVVKGKDGEEKTNSWANNFIDLTKYDVSKIDKIVAEYQTDATWANGKFGANVIDASKKNGYDFSNAPGANLAWDLDDKGEPQHWGNSDEGITFDIKTGKGTITWEGLTGKLYKTKNASENVFDAEDSGDTTGLTFQVGTINNPVDSVAADGTKTYKAATFAIQSIKFYDKAGNEVKPTATVAAAKASAVSKVTVKKTTSTATLSWGKAKNAAGYNIYKYNTKTKKYTKVASTTKTSYTIKKLASGTSYTYAVESYNKNKVAAAKKKVTFATGVYAPTKLSVKNTAKGKVTISFAKSKTAGVTYKIQYKTSAKAKYKTLKTLKTTKYSKAGFKKGKTYYFAVKAYKKVGSSTVASSVATKKVKIAK